MIIAAVVIAPDPKGFVNFLESAPVWFAPSPDPTTHSELEGAYRVGALQTAGGLRELMGQSAEEENAAVPSPKSTRDPSRPVPGEGPKALPPIRMAPDAPDPERKKRRVHPSLRKMVAPKK